MKKYVTYDLNGALTGAFNQDIRSEHTNVFEVSGAQYRDWTAYKMNPSRDGLVAADPYIEPAIVVDNKWTNAKADLEANGFLKGNKQADKATLKALAVLSNLSNKEINELFK